MILLTLGSLANMTPAFYDPARGFTQLRQGVLDLAVVELVIASGCLGLLYSRSRTPFLLWYSLGLLLIGLSMGTLIIEGSPATPLSWVGRGGQYLGGLYMLVAVLSLTKGGDARIPLERALRETEEKYRRIVDTANEGIMMADTAGKIVFANARMAEMLGYTTEELMGKTGMELADPDDLDISRRRVERRKVGDKEEYDVRFRRKDGGKLWAHASGTPVYNIRGAHIGNLAMYTDVTERRRAEERLAYQASLLANISDVIYSTDDQLLIKSWNHAAEKVYGLRDEEVRGKNVVEVTGSTFDPEMRTRLTRELLEGNSVTAEIEHVNRSGRRIIFESKTMLLRDAGGKPVGFVGVNRDITERKRVEKKSEQLMEQLKERSVELLNANEELEIKTEELAAQAEELESANKELRSNNEELQTVTRSLRETGDYLDSLITYANAPIIVWDPRSTITRFNRAFERLSGYAAGEVVGMDLSVLFPAERRTEALGKIKLTLAGEHWESVEIPIQHKEGGVRIALWNSANIYDADKKMLATIAQGQDITERKRVESELAEAKAQAELYLDLMGHDISNMHQIMMMQLEIAEDMLVTNGSLARKDKDVIDTPLKILERLPG